jgi:general secretion pathway protein K
MTVFAMNAPRGGMRPSARRRPDGFIVVAVLWILGALATLASIYAVYVINTATSMSVNDDRLQAEGLVTAALELTAYRITSADADTRPSQDAFAFRLGRANVTVEFKSEGGRIDLNSAPKELLAGLFAGLGAKYSDGEFYADRISGWRSPQDPDKPNEEASAYRTAGLSYAPRQAPFAHAGELSLVLGLPPFLVERAMPFVTVYSGHAEINVLAAAPEVVAAIPGMTPDRLYAVLAQRGRGPQAAQFIQNLLGPDQAGVTTEPGRTDRVTIRIDFDNRRRVQAEAVIMVIDDAGEPFRVLSWRDDFDGPG